MFLKNKNIIFKMRRSKVTDYAALNCSRTYLHYTSECNRFSKHKKISTFDAGIASMIKLQTSPCYLVFYVLSRTTIIFLGIVPDSWCKQYLNKLFKI